MTWRFALVGLCACVWSLWAVGCSPPSRCQGEVAQTTLDPNGSNCQNKCDCNNQHYTGSCDNGICKSVKRETCEVRDAKRHCVIDNPGGICTQGVQGCGDGLTVLRWGDCQVQEAAKEEKGRACGDGIDNDCDGQVDKADTDCAGYCNPGQREPCYTYGEGESDEATRKAMQDTQGKGNCRAGIRYCDDKSTWGPCQNEVTPNNKERCDGQDDDCDGSVDEDCDCKTGDKRPCGESKGICQPGEQLCDNAGKWGLCAGATGPAQEDCNGKDDDCDGQIDELQPTPCGPDTCTDKAGTVTCVGECKGGTRRCVDGAWGPCEGARYPLRELCNGKDDDCDGQTDESTDEEPLLGAPPAQCALQQGVCLGAQVAQGRTCQNGAWSKCSEADYKRRDPRYDPATIERCDNVDNNCNGLIDEGAPNCVRSLLHNTSPGYLDGSITGAAFMDIRGLALDKDGNLYIADTGNNRIRMLTPQGLVSTIAGDGAAAFKDGTAQDAQFHAPEGLAYDPRAHALYIADTGNTRIRKLDLNTKEVSTIAGTGTRGHGDGKATEAFFLAPSQLVLSGTQTLYILDEDRALGLQQRRHLLRKLSGGQVQTIPLQLSAFTRGLAIDATGAILLPLGPIVSARSVQLGRYDDAGKGEAFSVFGHPFSLARNARPLLAFGPSGDLWIAGDYLVRIDTKATPPGRALAYSDGGQGFRDGLFIQALFEETTALLVDARGGVYIADTQRRLRYLLPKVEACRKEGDKRPCYQGPTATQGVATCKAGEEICRQGHWSACTGMLPPGIETCNGKDDDCNGKIDDLTAPTLCEKQEGVCRKSQHTTTQCQNGSWQACTNNEYGTDYKAGTETTCNSKDDNCNGLIDEDAKGCAIIIAGEQPGDIDGTAVHTRFQGPLGLAFDTAGNLYIADHDNNLIRKLDKNGRITTVAGHPDRNSGDIDGPARQARLSSPSDLAYDPQKNALYISDTGNNRIRMLDLSANKVTTVAGAGGSGGYQEGSALQAKFERPTGLAYDANTKTLYIADTGNRLIRKLSNNQVSRIAGELFMTGSGVGGVPGCNIPASADKARFLKPAWLALDSSGALYISDTTNSTITRLTNGQLSGVVGTCNASNPLLNKPEGIAFDSAGNLYIADTGNRLIRKRAPNGTMTIYAGSGEFGVMGGTLRRANIDHPVGLAFDSAGNLYLTHPPLSPATNHVLLKLTAP